MYQNHQFDRGECECDCHRCSSMSHIVPCCNICKHCRKFFKRGAIKKHEANCIFRPEVSPPSH